MPRAAPPAAWSRRRAREVAALVGAEPRNVVFTSGGTEANMLALSPATGAGRDGAPCGRLLVSAIEHPSVLAGGRFPPSAVEQVPVTADGRIDLAALERRLAALAGEGVRRPLVSLMLANNETGIVQPVSQAARLVHEAGGLLHVDAVQAGGRIPCDINALGADLLTLSGHKIGGPKGVGALVKRDEALHLEPLIKGGGQERGARAGTENVAAIAGFGAAAAAARAGLEHERAHMGALRDRLEAGLQGDLPRCDHLRGRGRAAAQHHAVRGPRHEGRNRRHRLRSRRGRGLLRRGLLVGQGHALPCACRHGGFAAARARRRARQPGANHHRIRHRSLSRSLDKAVPIIN